MQAIFISVTQPAASCIIIAGLLNLLVAVSHSVFDVSFSLGISVFNAEGNGLLETTCFYLESFDLAI